MAVKGYTPQPDPQDFSSKFQLRSAQKAHEKFVKQAEEGRFVAREKPEYQSASRHRNVKGNPLLQAAAVRRNSAAYGNNSYKNPMDFVRDMWADGFISSEQAMPLAKEFETLGKPGPLMDAFLVEQHDLDHIRGKNIDREPKIVGLLTGDGSVRKVDELSQMRSYKGAELPSAEAPQHIEEARNAEAKIRSRVLNGLKNHTDDPNLAFAVALESLAETRETPHERGQRDMGKWDAVAAAVEAKAAPRDIGELTAVRTDSFTDREAARTAARTENKTPQR